MPQPARGVLVAWRDTPSAAAPAAVAASSGRAAAAPPAGVGATAAAPATLVEAAVAARRRGDGSQFRVEQRRRRFRVGAVNCAVVSVVRGGCIASCGAARRAPWR